MGHLEESNLPPRSGARRMAFGKTKKADKAASSQKKSASSRERSVGFPLLRVYDSIFYVRGFFTYRRDGGVAKHALLVVLLMQQRATTTTNNTNLLLLLLLL